MAADATINYYELVEQAWQLSSAAREYAKNAGHEVSVQEVFDKVFLPSGMVDTEKTQNRRFDSRNREVSEIAMDS